MKSNDTMKTVAVMVLAVILIGGGLIYWQWGSRSEAIARVAQLESELPDVDQVNADLIKSQEELETARIQLEHLERALPQEAYIPTLLKELEMLGTSKNVKITGIRPILVANTDPNAKDDEGYQKLDIDITGQGTYRAMLEMISALKEFPKILSVNTIAMQPRQDAKTTGSGQLDTTIRLRAFVFKEPLAPLEGSSEALKNEVSPDGSVDGTGNGSSTNGESEGSEKRNTKDLDARARRKDVAL